MESIVCIWMEARRKLSNIVNSQLLQTLTLKLLLLKFSAVFYFKYNLLYIYMYICVYLYVFMLVYLYVLPCSPLFYAQTQSDGISFPPLTLHTLLEEEILSGPMAYPQLRWKWASPKNIPASAPKWHKSQWQARDAQIFRVLSHKLQSSWFQSKHLWPLNPLSPDRFLKLISLIIQIIRRESSGKNNISEFHCILLKCREFCYVNLLMLLKKQVNTFCSLQKEKSASLYSQHCSVLR